MKNVITDLLIGFHMQKDIEKKMNEESFYTNFEHKIKMFPCSVCLRLPKCKEPLDCVLVSHNDYHINKFIKKGVCPDCGKTLGLKFSYTKQYQCKNCGHEFVYSHISKLIGRIGDRLW